MAQEQGNNPTEEQIGQVLGDIIHAAPQAIRVAEKVFGHIAHAAEHIEQVFEHAPGMAQFPTRENGGLRRWLRDTNATTTSIHALLEQTADLLPSNNTDSNSQQTPPGK